MQFYGALILFTALSAAYGIQCYQCVGKTCKDQISCPANFDRCSTVDLNGVLTKSCMSSSLCVDSIACCDKDLCNSAVPTGSSALLLLLLPSAIITVFL